MSYGRRNNNAHFALAPQVYTPRSKFDRSYTHKTTFNAGLLIPFHIDFAYPGDTINLTATVFSRMTTPIFPIMDNLYMDLQYWAVPVRLIWEHWEQFFGYQVNPDDTTDYTLPTITAPGPAAMDAYQIMSLQDYMGIRPLTPGIVTNNLFGRAYNLVWNEWYRDQNLQDSVQQDYGDGPDDPADYIVLPRGRRPDYFNSALPWPQKGPTVYLPLSGTAQMVTGADYGTSLDPTNPALQFISAGPAIPVPLSGPAEFVNGPGGNTLVVGSALSTGTLGVQPSNLYADLSTATAPTINDLRLAFQTQRIYEKDARGGTRYTEYLQSHWGVLSPDSRLQRPEFLGGSTSNINIHPVMQTSATVSGETPQGNLAAFATASSHKHGFYKTIVEHSVIIGLMSVRADYTYQQGTDAMHFYSTRFDLYDPTFAHLGEQVLYNREIFTQGNAQDAEPFAFQEAWAHLRFKNSRISGQFRSDAPLSLDAWHLAVDYATLPLFNEQFIVEDPPMQRVLAVADEPQFIADIFIQSHDVRVLPTYSVPGYVDHF